MKQDLHKKISNVDEAVLVVAHTDTTPVNQCDLKEIVDGVDNNQQASYRLDKLSELGLIDDWKDGTQTTPGASDPRVYTTTEQGDAIIEKMNMRESVRRRQDPTDMIIELSERTDELERKLITSNETNMSRDDIVDELHDLQTEVNKINRSQIDKDEADKIRENNRDLRARVEELENRVSIAEEYGDKNKSRLDFLERFTQDNRIVATWALDGSTEQDAVYMKAIINNKSDTHGTMSQFDNDFKD